MRPEGRIAVRARLAALTATLLASLLCAIAGEAQAQSAPGLVASYGFNEGTGTSTADLSTTGNTGTLTNSTSWSTLGKIGNALTFNGTNFRVNVNDSSSLDLTTGMTLEAWVFPTALGTATRTVIYKERSGGLVYGLFANNASSRPFASVRIGSTDFSVTGPSALPLNAWTHLAVTFNGSALVLYVNGAQVATQAAAGTILTSTGLLRIGGNAISSAQYFTGRIDEVRVFNQARNATQIQADMAASADTAGPTITARTPAAGATGIANTTTVTVTFSETMSAATINSGTFQLKDAAAKAVAGTVSYATATRIATFTPSTALAGGVVYTASVAGGTGGVTDISGNAFATTSSWSFTTRASTTTAVTSSLNPSIFGQGVTFTATVAPVSPATGTPTGTVQFRVDGVNVGSAVALVGGVATSSVITTLNVGNRAITAVYNGNTSFNTSTSPALTQAVAKANATVGTTSTANPSTAGQGVSFRATVAAAPPGTGTPTGTVQFVVDGSNFGTPVTLSAGVATSPATTTLTVGNHTVTSAYGGSTNFNSSNSSTLTQTVSPCAGSNPTASENCLTGNPASEWDISGVGDPSIQGYATEISVNRGETVSFKVDTTAGIAYKLDIYRMGYYGGLGARKVATISPITGQSQPNCLTDGSTGLIDCGNWAVSASWAVPSNATSGIYLAVPTRLDTGGASHIVFIVRDDASTSNMLFQTSDTTWQAYNTYGGNSLYTGNPAGRAYKVSYNRPFNTRIVANGQDWVFNAEYPMVRWLEANGYDVTYSTGVDTDRRGSLLLNHRVFLSVGHDEYWSGNQRTNVEAARNSGVNLAFFSGNEIFWKTRWENSIDASGAPYRTLVTYKETHANAVIDPADPPIWTGTWRDPRFSPPADGGRPENALAGTIFMANDSGNDFAMTVPEADGKMRLWRNTSIATLGLGQMATLPVGTLGYEWDTDLDNGARPAGLFRMSSTTLNCNCVLQDYGSTYGSGSLTHYLTLYKHTSGARVFGAGTIQWSWGLDSKHDRGSAAADVRMQQATVNLFADMGVQPTSLQSGLVAASASTDAAAPTSTITAPVAGASVASGTAVIISGTATDNGGGKVGGVEVSVDGGTTWHPANGRATWTYSWTTPGGGSSVTIKSRAVDDSGNLETPSAGTTVTVGSGSATCPCSAWTNATTPTVAADSDTSPVELGVKFRSSVAGYITAIRFYKSSTNVGTHVANLWTGNGALAATATFTNETAQGWQQVTLPAPTPISANTTYVASYHTNSGHYAADTNYFSNSVASGPLTFLANGTDGGNGLYLYGGGGFPTQTFQATNYWVDVVFTTTPGIDTSPPSVAVVSPASGAVRVPTTMGVNVAFNEPMTATTINSSTVFLRDGANNIVQASVTYNASAMMGTLTPANPLAPSTTYTATVKGGSTDPRVKDQAGNAMTADVTWSFTTGGLSPTQGPGGPILVITSALNPFTTYYAEILRAEGLNLFAVADINTVSATVLAAYDVAILGEMSLTVNQVNMLNAWVTAGGRLIAMRPDKQLATLLGLLDTGTTLSDAYLLMDTSKAPAAGLVNQTIQYHGPADRYALNGATSLATLYSNATTPAPSSAPAVTSRTVGSNGGQVAAFTYDLARSVVYTRQGNPAWSGQERDGAAPIRSDDLFFGAAAGDPRPDWVDLNKVAIPQADEQQRLLANLILTMNQGRRPLPRFWYFPRGLAAVVVMTGDDHATGGTGPRFDSYIANSSAGCVVDNWECIRGTSYVYPGTPLTNTQAVAYTAQGFEVALHVSTGCANYTPSSLEDVYAGQLGDWSGQYISLAPPVTNRTHCIVWSDYATQPQVELNHGIRLDTTYYYWPDTWVNDRPGLFTGSGMPMRFATATGAMIDVYQATSQMTDESGQSFPFNIDTLLNRALGPEGYYGVFTANMHTDTGNTIAENGSAAIVASAKVRGVPVVSARQMLNWLDGRNESSFHTIGWNGTTLTFAINAAASANGLRAMVPVPSGSLVSSVTANGTAVAYTSMIVKGLTYIAFAAAPATYQITFVTDTTPPVVTTQTPASGATNVSTGTVVRAVFNEPADASTISATTVQLKNAGGVLIAATVTYDAGTNAAILTPSAALATGATYTATIKAGVKDLAGNPTTTDYSWSFTTTNVGSGCPCSIWSTSTAPASLDSNDGNAVELGVKFRSDIAGSITAIRFYKGPNDSGAHVVHLWSSTGTLLATASSTGETASGWQQVQLPSAVAIAANTVYVASYHSTVGRYPYSSPYFTSTGVDNVMLHAPASGAVSGGNGVYVYGAGGFPTNTYQGTNYWVDVVFQP